MTVRRALPWRAMSCLALMLAAASLLLSVILYTRVGNDALRACQRANAVRVESNRRIPEHQADTRALILLTDALARNRALEARSIASLGRAFHVGTQLRPYVRVLRRASREDSSIRTIASHIHFHRLRVVDCQTAVKSG